MKKSIKLLFVIGLTIISITSCVTMNYTNKEAMTMPPLKVKRSDYKLTSDLTIEVQITSIFWDLIIDGLDKNNMKIGVIAGEAIKNTPDEKLAIYELIKKYPEVDYLTNIRYVKSYSRNFLGFKKVYKTKIIAKGIILNTDK